MKSFHHQETIQALQTILHIEQHLSGIDYLKEFAKNIAQTFEVKYVFVGHAIKPGNDSVQTDVVWAGNDFYKNFIYQLKDTPCENVLSGNRVCVYPNDVGIKFPNDTLLLDMGVESYIGAPILAADGQLTCILVLLDDKPLQDIDFYAAVVDFLAARAGAELERYYVEENLKKQVLERTSELEKSNQELQKALSEIKILQGILPICATCKKIRDDQGYWQQVESYVSKHSEASFSHSVCPGCLKDYYKDLDGFLKNNR